MKQVHFPWRPLGAILVEDGLLTETQLELAVAEQRRTGRMLGQILVDFGYLTGFALARVLADQHGVDLQKTGEDEPVPPGDALAEAPATDGRPVSEGAWRPLGKLLVEKGFLGETELRWALAEQRQRRGLRLGELLVERGLLSGAALGRALAEQHGVDLGSEDELEQRVQAAIKPVDPGQPTYQVCEVVIDPTYRTTSVLHESPNFLEAADFAFEYVDEHEPVALEIQRTGGSERETVWMYSQTRAAAAAASRKDLVDTFGFDPTSWGRPST